MKFELGFSPESLALKRSAATVTVLGNLAELLIPRGTATVLAWRALCPEPCVPNSTTTVFFLTLSGKLAITQVLSLERAEAPCTRT